MPALPFHGGGFGSPQPGGAVCAKPSCLEGNEELLGLVEMGSPPPLSLCPTPGRWEHRAGLLLHCWQGWGSCVLLLGTCS